MSHLPPDHASSTSGQIGMRRRQLLGVLAVGGSAALVPGLSAYGGAASSLAQRPTSAGGVFANAQSAALADGVRPIAWSSFDRMPIPDDDGRRMQQILVNSNRYALTTWWDQHFAGQDDGYLTFGGTGEHQIRHPAAEAFALATSLQTGAYDEAQVGVAHDVARARAVRLVESLAFRHHSNSSGGWGPAWQSAFWAAMAGFAGWQLWSDLDPAGKNRVARMVSAEADRFLGYKVPYWRDANGTEQFRGDSKSEENSWNAMVLQVATAMLPEHPNWNGWMDKNLELLLSSFSRPQDLSSDKIYHGRRLSDWLQGTNMTENGLVINHGFVHPDYMTCAPQNAHATLTCSLARTATPIAALHNVDVIYETLVGLEFDSPPYEAPGGTMYVDRSDVVYYPDGTDWGASRRANFFATDVVVGELGLDRAAHSPARIWERRHAKAALAMQERHDDGRTYSADDDDTYRGREEWVAMHAAWSHLLKWLVDQRAVQFTNATYA